MSHSGRSARTNERPPIEVADIFRARGEMYRQQHTLTADQLKVMHAIETCRTAVLGGHLDVCDSCGYSHPSYNSCRNRHCPKCQSLVQAKWLHERLERLLPVSYFHVVFTLPAPLRPLCRRNPKRLYGLLFECASDTLLTLGQDKERLGGQLGITAVLHTWTRELTFHPHLHCIVTGGGLSKDGDCWVPAWRKYLFPIKVLAKLFRGKFLDALRRAHDDDPLCLGGIDFPKLLDSLHSIDWNVYAKPPFGGPEQVFRYLGRYTHRVGISNQRLISFDGTRVCFATKGGKILTLEADEFIRRFLLHVLPAGFVKIRHYGLWAAGNVKTRLELARQRLLEATSGSASGTGGSETTAAVGNLTWQQLLLKLTGRDVTRCPRCHTGRLVRHPLPAASATATPRGEASAPAQCNTS